MLSIFDEAKKKLGHVLGHPYVQKASLLGEEVLTITASLAHNKNVISLGGAVMAGANVLANAFDVSITSPLTHFINKHDLKVYNGNLHKLMLKSGASEEFTVSTAFMAEGVTFMKMKISDEHFVYWNVTASNVDSFDGTVEIDNVALQYWLTQDFDLKLVHDFFWRKYKNGIGLSYGKQSEQSGSRGPDIMNLPKPNVYTDLKDHPIADISAYIARSKQLDISRSFLLYGQPGTGKTSWVERIAENFESKIVKVDTSFLQTISSTEIEHILSILSPEIVLFDDFDRLDLDHYEGQFLYITENLKRKYPKITFFATVNEPEELGAALLRPGRFDEKIEFVLADGQACTDIVMMYANTYNLIADRQEIANAIGTSSFTPAECKEAISRKVLRPELRFDDIFTSLIQYRGFGDTEGEITKRKSKRKRRSKLSPMSIQQI
jgi:hypothetical protein